MLCQRNWTYCTLTLPYMCEAIKAVACVKGSLGHGVVSAGKDQALVLWALPEVSTSNRAKPPVHLPISPRPC